MQGVVKLLNILLYLWLGCNNMHQYLINLFLNAAAAATLILVADETVVNGLANRPDQIESPMKHHFRGRQGQQHSLWLCPSFPSECHHSKTLCSHDVRVQRKLFKSINKLAWINVSCKLSKWDLIKVCLTLTWSVLLWLLQLSNIFILVLKLLNKTFQVRFCKRFALMPLEQSMSWTGWALFCCSGIVQSLA